MAERVEKTCPICTEEMDFTDQQLKPCKCGYEMCVWCWHHIMEIAEKDGTEGRCPACRTLYDKEKIVGMAANCERLVAERNLERKQKLQKLKPKAPEGRKHLSDVRIIQRNLVYIIGLPLNLTDEDLLQRREYFGQYGKVLKLSISRTANGVIQHSSNNSCCVYITYSKEEEAIRCIQSVHGFVLDGRSLRACFGTTKYCHAWLKNLPCSNPDCLYLHDYGSQDDCFSKDDLVSAFARSRVQQIIGATNNLNRRSWNVLPPPADEYSKTAMSMGKPAVKIPSHYDGDEVRGSHADNGTRRSCVPLTAASWVMRASTTLPPMTNFSVSSGPTNQNRDISANTDFLASEVVSSKRSTYDVKNSVTDVENWELYSNAKLNSSKHLSCLPAAMCVARNIAAPSTEMSSLEHTKPSYSSGFIKDGSLHADGVVQGLCSGLSSISIYNHFKDEYPGPVGSDSDITQMKGSQKDNYVLSDEASISTPFVEATVMEDLLGLDDQRLEGFEGIHLLPSISSSPCLLHNLNQPSCHLWQHSEVSNKSNVDMDPKILCAKHEEVAYPLTSESTESSYGFNDNTTNILADLGGTFHSSSVCSEKGVGNLGMYEERVPCVDYSVASEMGESSIISNILSLDNDAWEDSLTSPHSLVKLLSETGKQHGSIKVPNLQKPQDKNQSRFSFARQEDFLNHVSDLKNSLGSIRDASDEYSASHDCMEKKDPCIETYQNMFSSSSSLESDKFPSSDPFTSYKLPVSRGPTSIPPGFSVPTKGPPPGFPSHGRTERAFNNSENHFLQTSATTGNVGINGDVKFFDPAIMEVGKGILTRGLNNAGFDIRPILSPQFSPFNHDTRLKLMMQQSISTQPNVGFPDHFGNTFSPQNDTYQLYPMLIDQVQPNNPSAFTLLTAQQISNMQTPNGRWGGWNDVRSISGLGNIRTTAK